MSIKFDSEKPESAKTEEKASAKDSKSVKDTNKDAKSAKK